MNYNKTNTMIMAIMGAIIALVAFTGDISPTKAAVMVTVMVFAIIVLVITNYEKFNKNERKEDKESS